VLFSQFSTLSADLQSQLNAMLTKQKLETLVTPADIERVFGMYERIFRRYIDNPLWPLFKFPLTDNEQTKLRNEFKQRIAQLDPLFEEMSFKVKYGGISPELKDKAVYEIARVVQQLLPQAAFLRTPHYSGVSCQYLGKYGFTVVIKSPLYIEGEKPKEKFKVMKYFHLGHRIENVVKQEM
jgi:hypothetical protein